MSALQDNSPETGTSKEKEETALEILTEKVEELYRFRDHYFENHSLDEAINRYTHTEKEMNAVLDKFKEFEESGLTISSARYFYLKGRALNIMPDYSKEAEELLSKAIKLDPKLVNAWNELGDCYWKNKKISEAINCFKGALKQCKNKVSLRSLSMLSRQEVTKTPAEKLRNIKIGLKYAKEAVDLDNKDGLSWSVLGNAHLYSFFSIEQNPRLLAECLKAYAEAESHIVASYAPDLHYNKAFTLKYEQEYEEALKSLNKAALYDPVWEPPQQKEKELVQYLKDICTFVTTSGKMKAKKLQQTLQSIDSKQLGPYAGGSYTSTKGQTVKLEETPFSELKADLNEEKVVLGKVVCSVRNEDAVPFTFCMVDKQGTCVAVAVFNLAEGKGVIIGDSVAIPEPFVTDVDFNYKENHFKFRLIRVPTPLVLVINGKKANKNLQGSAEMSMCHKFD